jgi:hypothetical protein
VGQPLPEVELARLEALSGWLGTASSPVSRTLAGLLSPDEVAALGRRIARLLDTGRFPAPNSSGPAVPWPPL